MVAELPLAVQENTMSDEVRGICWNCGHGLAASDYGREATCIACGKDTHVCRNCRHFAPGRPNECVEPMVERVLLKDRANFCELFEPTKTPTGSGSKTPDAEALRQAAEALFK
jgi:hypothetical protein